MNGQSWPVASHAEVLAVASNPYGETTKPTKLDVFMDRLPHYPFLMEAMQDDKTTAYPRGRQRIGGLVCQYGRLKLRIEEAAAWGFEEASLSFLTSLSAVFDLFGMGAYPTPGGLGMSLMESTYLAAGHHRQSRPSQALRAALLDNRIGGRSDWTDSDEMYERVWEADQRNSYCSAAALPLPVGGVTRFLKGEVHVQRRRDSGRDCYNELDQRGTGGYRSAPVDAGGSASTGGEDRYKTWFAHCAFWNTVPQKNSPILERLPSGRLVPFTRVGKLERFAFKEEAEAFAARPNCYVVVGDGWGWLTMAPVLRPWAEKMHLARAEAALVSPGLELMVKLCIVAAIGRHGCRPERRQVIPLEQAVDGDTVLTDTLDGEWATHNEPEPDACWNTVWHDYIVMMIRLQNYELQVAEAERENQAIGSNVDAVYFLARPAVVHEPDVLGGWRVRDKHDVRFPYARGLICEEKVALPGIPRGSPRRGELTNATH